MSLVPALEMLQDCWPSDFSDREIARYAERLNSFPHEAVLQAVEDLSVTNTFRPSIAQIVERVAERALRLPSTEEAWGIAERGSLRSAPGPVRQAAEHVGGRWQILHSDNIPAVRSQFRKAYENLRQQALNDYARGGARLYSLPQRLNQYGLPAPTMMNLPETEHGVYLPVHARWLRRAAGHELEVPTEAEQAHAVVVLREMYVEHGEQNPLYVEAERVFMEAGE